MKILDYVRCGIPDCDWGFRLPDISEKWLDRCYAEFRKHCIKSHRLENTDADSEVFIDLQKETLTLIKPK